MLQLWIRVRTAGLSLLLLQLLVVLLTLLLLLTLIMLLLLLPLFTAICTQCQQKIMDFLHYKPLALAAASVKCKACELSTTLTCSHSQAYSVKTVEHL